jgi:hypothetical protein
MRLKAIAIFRYQIPARNPNYPEFSAGALIRRYDVSRAMQVVPVNYRYGFG